jgi:alkaline phosphatase D
MHVRGLKLALACCGACISLLCCAPEREQVLQADAALPDSVSLNAADGGVRRSKRLLCEASPQSSLEAPVVLPQLPDADLQIMQAGAVPPQPSLGPILGGIGSSSVRVWLRAEASADWAVVVWPEDLPDQVRRIPGTRLQTNTDNIGVITVTGLRPSTRYAYRIELGHPDQALHPVSNASNTFHTLADAGESGHLRVVVGSDIGSNPEQPIFDQIGALQPDLLLLLGDQIYADQVSPDVAGYAQKYVATWQIANLANLLRNVPSFMMWDDHEIIDNYFDGKSDRFPPALLAYELFVEGRNPTPVRAGAHHYSFDAGDVAFFVLDERSHRSSEMNPDGPDKTMLGPDQKEDLFEWLLCSTAKVKIIASPVTFSDWATTGEDDWMAYATEREEILSFIEHHRVDNVLLLSGDQHWSAVFRQQRRHYTLYEFMPTPLSKSHRAAPTEPAADILARDDDQFVFGVVDIDTTVEPARVDLTLCADQKPCTPGREPEPSTGLDVNGEPDNVPFTIHLTTDDFGVTP